jgi:hypothetical protein
MNTSKKITPVFLVTFFLILTTCTIQAQSNEIPVIRNPDSYKELDALVNITELQNGSTVEKSITMHMNEKLYFDIIVPSAQDYYYDEEPKLVSITNYDTDGICITDQILVDGGEHLNHDLFPQREGFVVYNYETKWHDRGKSPKGVPIIINKNGPPYAETLRITVTIKAVGE